MNRNDTVREVAERLSIAEIIGEYVSLKRSGSNFLGLCPFHGEKTPSFNVNPAGKYFTALAAALEVTSLPLS
jgi:DNA primase